MDLYKLIILVAVFVAVSAVDIESEEYFQAAEANVAHTRQKRAPLLLKKLLLGGLLAKKAVLLGGGLGLAGVGLGAALSHKKSHGQKGYPMSVNNGPLAPGHGGGSSVYIEYAPPARPPAYYDQYPSANPGGHYGTPVYPIYPKPLPPPPPPPPSFGPDCYTGHSSYNNLHHSAGASAGYA